MKILPRLTAALTRFVHSRFERNDFPLNVTRFIILMDEIHWPFCNIHQWTNQNEECTAYKISHASYWQLKDPSQAYFINQGQTCSTRVGKELPREVVVEWTAEWFRVSWNEDVMLSNKLRWIFPDGKLKFSVG